MKSLKRLIPLLAPAIMMLASWGEAQAQQYQFGFLSYTAALQSMPEYSQAQAAMQALQKKYNDEASYNEDKFKRMFADYLQGQKDFPEQIMLKRQRELQVAMEQGISFRKDAQRQLSEAEAQLIQPLRHKLDSVLSRIGQENGLLFIGNTDGNSFPFIHKQIAKDITSIVIARLKGEVIPINRPSSLQNGLSTGMPAPSENRAAAPYVETDE